MNAEPSRGELFSTLAAPPPRRRSLAVSLLAFGLIGLGLGAALLVARAGRPYRAAPFVTETALTPDEQDPIRVAKRAAQAASALERMRPRGAYLVIDSYRNRLRLYENGELKHEAVCSTGTGTILRDPRNGREWIFDTPIGERVIERKVKNPVWAKPDWAFIEEGYLPPTNPEERFDPFSLGDYALYLGNGYIIHGTLFQTLLGRRVTHGCIRLGDQDLELIYRNVRIGSRVYLY
jgi:L,D-transpeptidase YbiS